MKNEELPSAEWHSSFLEAVLNFSKKFFLA